MRTSCLPVLLKRSVPTFRPTAGFLYRSFAHLYPKYEKLPPVIQILPLHQNPSASPDYNMNLETFLCTLLPILSGFVGYQPYYYYTQTGREFSSYELFPFFLLTEKKLLLLSSDMMTCIFTENPEAIHAYQQEFQRALENSSQFFLQSDSPATGSLISLVLSCRQRSQQILHWNLIPALH